MVWPFAGVRALARSQSVPVAHTREPPLVVVSDTVGFPVRALAAACAPMVPLAPVKVATVMDPSYPLSLMVAVILALVSRPRACACHTSAVPRPALDRTARVHRRPSPLTPVIFWVAWDGPPAEMNAKMSSLPDVVVTAGEVIF